MSKGHNPDHKYLFLQKKNALKNRFGHYYLVLWPDILHADFKRRKVTAWILTILKDDYWCHHGISLARSVEESARLEVCFVIVLEMVRSSKLMMFLPPQSMRFVVKTASLLLFCLCHWSWSVIKKMFILIVLN